MSENKIIPIVDAGAPSDIGNCKSIVAARLTAAAVQLLIADTNLKDVEAADRVARLYTNFRHSLAPEGK